jgi:hypothetical protein
MSSLILSAMVNCEVQIAFVAAAGTAGHAKAESTSTVERKLGFRDILDVAYKMAQSVANMSNQSQKKHYFGEMIKLSETMNENVESLQGLSVENLLDGHFLYVS